MKIWLVYAGVEEGAREDCSIFYEEPVAFLSEEKAKEYKEKRIRELWSEVPNSQRQNIWTHVISVEVEE